jgi:hypothetical protein
MSITIFSADREQTQWSVKIKKDGQVIELTYPLDSEPELSQILADAEALDLTLPVLPDVPIVVPE